MILEYCICGGLMRNDFCIKCGEWKYKGIRREGEHLYYEGNEEGKQKKCRCGHEYFEIFYCGIETRVICGKCHKLYIIMG